MLRAETLLEELKKRKITHVIGLPDNASAALFRLLDTDVHIELLTVTREGEAFAVAAGLWIGGKKPAVVIQNTGLLESGDSFRGTVQRMRIPLLCFLTYRGYAKMTGAGIHPPTGCGEIDSLSEPQLDSVALVTEPTLQAWGLPYRYLENEDQLGKIQLADREAEDGSRPVALIIPTNLA